MNIFIMAQGKGSRWEVDEKIGWFPPALCKQLAPIGKETIITRTIRQLGSVIKIIVMNGVYSKHLPIESGSLNAMLPLHEPTGCLMRGIFLTKDYWSQYRNIILLGDVVFSNNAIKAILDDDSPIRIFGRLGSNKVTGKEAKELFALSFRGDNSLFVSSYIRRLWDENDKARMWDLYDFLKLSIPNVLYEIDDYTDDVDSPEEYQQFYPKLQESAVLDDRNYEKV